MRLLLRSAAASWLALACAQAEVVAVRGPAPSLAAPAAPAPPIAVLPDLGLDLPVLPSGVADGLVSELPPRLLEPAAPRLEAIAADAAATAILEPAGSEQPPREEPAERPPVLRFLAELGEEAGSQARPDGDAGARASVAFKSRFDGAKSAADPVTVEQASGRLAVAAVPILTEYVEPVEPHVLAYGALKAMGVRASRRSVKEATAGVSERLRGLGFYDAGALDEEQRALIRKNILGIMVAVAGEFAGAVRELLASSGAAGATGAALDSQRLLKGLRGMVAALGDPHSMYLDAQGYRNILKLSRSYVGVGTFLDEETPGVPATILGVLPGLPADEAGLRAGDEILKVDGEAVSFAADALAKIRGRAGTPVALEVRRRRGERESRFFVELVRVARKVPNAFSALLPGSVGYVQIRTFRGDADKEVLAALRGLRGRGMRSLILDVRNNPGGDLTKVRRLTAAFLRKGQRVATLRSRAATKELAVPRDGEFADVPILVLINGDSASASEVLAAALQDHGRARLVGSSTYGKGTSQVIVPLGDGSAAVLTSSRWHRPSGPSIRRTPDGRGSVQADVAVKTTPAQEAKVWRLLMGRLLVGGEVRLGAADPALARAVRLSRAMQQGPSR